MHLPHRAVQRLSQVRPFGRRCQSAPPFDRFTERTRDALALAQDEARRFGHAYLGTEHLLLGILRRSDSVGARILGDRGVRLPAARAAVARTVGHGQLGTDNERPMTPRLKRVFDLAVNEAKARGHGYIGTEHLVLAIAREGEGVAAVILRDLGVTAEQLRADVVRIVGTGAST